jgi:enoyl-CoA hydratase/carnithine racemase
MTNEQILYTVADRLATITLNRPDKLNAWTATMECEVRSAVERAEADDAVRVIVLTGAGRGFCAGADMSLLGAVAKQGVTDQVRERTLDKADGHRKNISARTSRKSIPIFSPQRNR